MNIATSTAMMAADSHRPGCRSGTASISRGRPVTVSGASETLTALLGEEGGQLAAPPLTFASVIAPACTPHLVSSVLYEPSAIILVSAPATASRNALDFLGMAMPYGAVP